ncbi:MAG: phosphoenolpyruvate carboxykinase (ATP) [Acidobacteria bacterium]|nr:phosphoenolpyruvate carboxykinase (ATP) [Acidobacteriota bacterium]|tara:strand:- start:2786 stop:4372 length:1587 start_codon:yes stop_codon:yes gene_type:complete
MTSVTTDQRLDSIGIVDPGTVYWNLSTAALFEEAVSRREGTIAADGPLVCRTGQHTGRSPKDRFLVHEPSSAAHVAWGAINRPIESAQFEAVQRAVAAHLQGKDLFVQDCYAGADPEYRLPVRVVTERAWHSLFARHMFITESDRERLAVHQPELTVVDAAGCRAIPEQHGTNSDVFILLDFAKGLVLIGGTAYAGEIKKSVFTVMNYLLPLRRVMPMHCSANVGATGDVALFFGLSGTGKTTLSSDPERRLIGDDEHGWSDRGVFNFEGGCYAKMIRLSPQAEPQIYATTRRFGTLLENVSIDPVTRELDFDDDSITENTRGAYPLSAIDSFVESGQAGHPKNVVMLTADAFGVLPPIARLSPEAAMYHFLSGYTAKVAGTERGVTEPTATFSTCFGAPFMVWPPTTYASLLGERLAAHGANAWLVNTGWTGGSFGVGHRMPIAHTRALIAAALSGALDDGPFETDPVFNVDVPLACPGVPAEVLQPRGTWTNPADYDAQARKLGAMFTENFASFEASPAVAAAGPR